MTNGKVHVEFFGDNGRHEYLLNGESAVSVTTLLSAEGLSGSPFYTERDRKRGSAVHRIALLMGKRPWQGSTVEEIVDNSPWVPETTSPILVPYGFSLAKYFLESGFRPELVEQPVGSLIWRVVGTFDAWGRVPSGKRRMVDYKSGKPEPAAILQLNIYAMCAKETLGLETDELQVVWLQPDGEYKASPPVAPGGRNLMVAQSAINCYHWRKEFHKLG